MSLDPSQSLATVPNVRVDQILDTASKHITTGTLSVLPGSDFTSPPSSLLLQITGAHTLTFPLTATTVVLTDSDKRYRITNDDLKICLILPPDVSDEDNNALKFEKVLVEYGFLTTGLVADADDIAGALKDSAVRTAEAIKSYATDRVDRREEVEPYEETHYGERTKKIVDSTVKGTGKAAEVTGKIGEAVTSGAESVGKWAGSMMPEKEEGGEKGIVRETASEAATGAVVVGDGIAQSVGTVTGAIGDATSKIAEHEKGPEAKEMVEKGREIVGNVGDVAYDVTVGTSVVWHAGEAGVAAARDSAENTK
ncbi:hypothetical protein BZA77DRAFT_312785 [Pyronema omphalodes]|nr:hypothetical protein BZA77DRAFT_312785 [Pyronema omphalodes]